MVHDDGAPEIERFYSRSAPRGGPNAWAGRIRRKHLKLFADPPLCTVMLPDLAALATSAKPSSEPGRIEARRHERAPLSVEVTLEGDHNFFAGLSENISEGGIFVATHRLLRVGSRLTLELTLPGCGAPIVVEGEVRWVRVYNESSDAPPGMGVRFVELSSEAREAIRAFVQTRDPLFWEED